ncbi:MAG: type II toxin-antitoxin system PemK/MazF family toxin [bacterium]|nr:type II toxin-antitoxin system PemK/MazF family toxin [bacterium]MCY3579857.1 type II toxin-antitoxin system PemK/MazF family toxin [bacterium]MDE0643773.1 type II toxin-antitoxin system PemK/MazF family toxin [bacterium]MXX63941.1 type II toxin-antitoxin system PemK/MazF family toxin [Acidimicrobiia bacterium]
MSRRTRGLPYRGEVWWWEPEQDKPRPVVILSPYKVTEARCRAIVAPCTTKVRGLPIEVLLEPGEDPVAEISAVNLHSIRSVRVSLLVQHMGRISEERMHQVCTALKAAVACG